MESIEAIFEHGVFRPIEPISLAEGSRVTLVVDAPPDASTAPSADTRRPMFGALKGKMWIAPDFDAPLEEFKDYM